MSISTQLATTIRRSPWRNGVLGAFAIAVALTVTLTTGNDLAIYLAGTIAILGMAAVGQGWLMGWTGQVSLGGGAIFAVGAYAAALVSDQSWGGNVVLSLLAAVVGGAAVGGIVAVPGLRFRGIYLLLATLALQYIIEFLGERVEHDPDYVAGVPAVATSGSALVEPGIAIAVTAGVLLMAAVILVDRLYRSQAGREWAAIKENELAASAMGVNIRRRKTSAFVGSSVLTALAGGLYAYYIGFVSYTTFNLGFTIQLLIMVFVGGSVVAVGPVIGAAVVTLLPYLLDNSVGAVAPGDWYTRSGPFLNMVIFGIVLTLILLYARGGLLGVILLLRRSTDAEKPPLPEVAVSRIAVEDGGPSGALLEVEDVGVRYRGGSQAVAEVSFSVAEGEILALIGRNGAGKSSVLKAIGGFPLLEHAATSGRVRVRGREIAGRGATVATRAGVVLVPEQLKVFAELSVQEHFELTGHNVRQARARLEEAGLTMLVDRMDAHAGNLSGGERQYLALSTALLRRPQVLLVDEMSLGLAPVAIRRVAGALQAIRETLGCTILIVEQNVRMASEVADRLAIMESGRLTWIGPPAEVPRDRLEDSYFGAAGAAS